MRADFQDRIAGKYGEPIRQRVEEMMSLPEFAGATDAFLLDRALYEEHRQEIEAAAAEASLPFQSD